MKPCLVKLSIMLNDTGFPKDFTIVPDLWDDVFYELGSIESWYSNEQLVEAGYASEPSGGRTIVLNQRFFDPNVKEEHFLFKGCRIYKSEAKP